MVETERWWASKTIWASLVTMAVGLAATFGIIVNISADVMAGQIVGVVVAITGLVAAIGRVTAKKRIVGKNG